MIQVFYNESGIWYLGFLTNDQQTKLFETPNWTIPEDNSNSEVKTYAVDQSSFFGFQSFEMTENALLASLSII